MNKNGFTLIESMLVVIIIGILFAVSIPKFKVAIDKANATRQLMEDRMEELENNLEELDDF